MPYPKISDLPDWVKKAFPENVQEVYRKAFNAALAKHKDEGKAAQIAISAVQKMGYAKKGDKWIKAEYVKDLGLKPGEYLHPNEDGKKLNITEQDLMNYVTNTQKVLDNGGAIPVTISHPDSERDKIELKEGDIVGVWYDIEEQVPYMAFNPSALVKGWIDEGKLKAVSPGIYHDVVTSIGKLPSLIDHVALTNSPFNIQQSGFLPVTAEKFGKAVLFFENRYISKEQGGDVPDILKPVLEGINTLTALFTGKSKTRQGGDKMELEQAKTRIAELEASEIKLKKDIGDRDKTILDLTTKNEKYEQDEKERIEKEQTQATTEFEAKVNKLIEKTKIKPENKKGLMNYFKTLYENKVDVKQIHEMLLDRYEDAKGIQNTLKHEEFTVEKKVYDRNSEKGQAKLTELYTAKAKELAKAEGKSDWHGEIYERAMDEVNEDLGFKEE